MKREDGFMRQLSSLLLGSWLVVFAGAIAEARQSTAPSLSTPGSADQKIVIASSTKSVSVHENEIVEFMVGTRSFTLKFDGNKVYYNLATLAPRGLLTHSVKVYVAPNPTNHEQGIP